MPFHKRGLKRRWEKIGAVAQNAGPLGEYTKGYGGEFYRRRLKGGRYVKWCLEKKCLLSPRSLLRDHYHPKARGLRKLKLLHQ